MEPVHCYQEELHGATEKILAIQRYQSDGCTYSDYETLMLLDMGVEEAKLLVEEMNKVHPFHCDYDHFVLTQFGRQEISEDIEALPSIARSLVQSIFSHNETAQRCMEKNGHINNQS